VYGSNDYGQHVLTKNDEFNGLMARAAHKLKLKGHVAGVQHESCVNAFIYGPADIEGHRGRDDRFYVIDLARVCPPVAKTKRPMQKFNRHAPTQLYRLFRPEYLARYCIVF
jgi:hypothetical protein